MYKVLGNPRARTMRALWMLEELGQDYEIDPVGPHSDPIKIGNPGGKLPVLHDGDAIITDSVAIITYLADKHGTCSHPAGTVRRARQDSMTQFCVDEIEGALWTASKNSFIHDEAIRVPAIIDVSKFEFGKAMATLAVHLGENEFVAGDDFTVPDLLLGHCAGWAKNAKFDIPEGPVADYFSRMRARPAFGRALSRAAEASPST